jgi:hypothetical protein
LVTGRSYCSRRCARAELLEALEFFEQSKASTVISDASGVTAALRVLYLSVVTDLVVVEKEASGPPSDR